MWLTNAYHSFSYVLKTPTLISQILTFHTYYLMLDFLTEGPCEEYWLFYTRIRDNRLCWYASQFFDLHVNYVEGSLKGLQEKLNGFLSLDGAVLASVLQLRRIGDAFDLFGLKRDFDPFSWSVK
jgi:hypothetical protein